MNMKKIASVVLALALSVSVFAACGSNGNSSASSTASTESSTASTDSSTASTDSSAAATGDKIDVLNQSETMDVSVAVMTGFTAADSRVQKELEETKAEMAKSKFATFVSKAQDIEGGKLFITKIENLDADAVKAGIEMLSNKLGESIIVLANERMVIVKVTDGFVKKGINAGKIVGEIARATGANGGGRPNFAQGGVKDASKLEEVLSKIENELK